MKIPVRYCVAGFAATAAMVTYLDRVAIGMLAPSIIRDLHLTQGQMSYVFSAFTLAYAIFEVPTAWFADRIGSRKVLTRIVVWWSTFTMATAGAWNYPSLLALRFLFGAGEAGAWPTVARAFGRWIPSKERGTVQGVFFAGAHLAGGVTPLLVTWLLLSMSWRSVFVVFGAIGLVWALGWYAWFRDEPSEHRAMAQAELKTIEEGRGLPAGHGAGGGGLGSALHPLSSVVPLCVMYFANGYGFYFLITWLPTYLAKVRGFSSAELGLFAGLPLILSVVADICGGSTTDFLTRRYGLRFGRCAVGFGAYLVAGGTMIAGVASTEARLAAILIAIAGAASMFTLAPSWACCIDIGGRNAAVLSAVMNTSGQIGGVLSPIVLALLVKAFSGWSVALYLVAALYLVGAICWLAIRPGRSNCVTQSG